MSRSKIIESLKLGGWLQVKHIATLADCSVQAVYTSISKMADRGEIEEVVQMRVVNGRRYHVRKYKLKEAEEDGKEIHEFSRAPCE